MWKPLVHLYIWPRFHWLWPFWDVDNEQATQLEEEVAQAHKRSPWVECLPSVPPPLCWSMSLIKIVWKIFCGFLSISILGNLRTPSPVTKPVYRTVHWVFQPICPNYIQMWSWQNNPTLLLCWITPTIFQVPKPEPAACISIGIFSRLLPGNLKPFPPYSPASSFAQTRNRPWGFLCVIHLPSV